MNFFGGVIRRSGDQLTFSEDNPKAPHQSITLPPSLAAKTSAWVDKPVTLGIRPEDILIASSVEATDAIESKVEVYEPMGAETLLYLHNGSTHFIARVKATDDFACGQQVYASFNLNKTLVFDTITGKAL